MVPGNDNERVKKKEITVVVLCSAIRKIKSRGFQKWGNLGNLWKSESSPLL